jgi:hypothetical protein
LIHHRLPHEGGESAGSQSPVAAEVPTVIWQDYTQCRVPYIKLPEPVAGRSRICVILLAIAARLAQPLSRGHSIRSRS